MHKMFENLSKVTGREIDREFLEVWILAILFVTIFGLVAQTKQSPSRPLSQAVWQADSDPYGIRLDHRERGPGRVESGM